MTVPHVRQHAALSAAAQNRLIDEHNDLVATAGLHLRQHLALFEVTGTGLVFDNEATAPSSLTPYVEGKMLLYASYTGETSTDSTPITSRLYHPLAQRDSDGLYTGEGAPLVGEWVWCYANWQTGRWEIVAGQCPWYWCKLDADLDYDDTTGVTASIWSDDWSEDTGDNLTGVLPPPTMTSGTIASGSWVRVTRRPDGVWYVDMAPC